MFRILLALVAGLIGAPAICAPAPVAQAVAFDATLEQAALAIDEGRFSEALALVARREQAGSLSDHDADWAAYLKSRALAATGAKDEAEKTIRQRQREHPNAYNWSSLVSILVNCGKHEEAARAIVSLEDGEFQLANRLRPGVIDAILSALETSKTSLRDELLTKLVADRYTGPTSQHVPDQVRLQYINLLLRHNRTEDAARETVSLEAPEILSVLLTDKSFSALWDRPVVSGLLAPGALVARVERGLQARLEQASLSSSDWLDLMHSLRVIQRPDEAVRLGLKAIEQARTSKRSASWQLRLEVAAAYADLGESWAARRTARELMKEQAQLPVPLRVAVADILEQTGDDEGALLMLSTIDGVERLPKAEKVAVCAADGLSRLAKRDAALAQLESAGASAAAELLGAYVCAGQYNKASKRLAAMLRQPDTRTAAILMAQIYADPATAGNDLSELRYRMRAIVASDTVQDAIKAYARTLGLPFTIANAR
jgi:tetratricopeptide (TPR) repeat protein